MTKYVSKENLEQYDAALKSNIETRLQTYIGNAAETVNVTITSNVSTISPKGMVFNVFLNNGTIPTSYTTDSNGEASFQVERGSTYKIEFNSYGNSQPINPVQHTALFATRDIKVTYEPIQASLESSEEVEVEISKYVNGDWILQENATVICIYNNKTEELTTNNQGIVTFYVPYGQSYTLNVNNFDDYYVLRNHNYKTYTATLAHRKVNFRLYPFNTGVRIIDTDGNDYSFDDWKLLNKSKEDVLALSYGSSNLAGKITLCIKIEDLLKLYNEQLPNKQWCTQNIQFNSIPLDGNNSSADYYYDGETATHLIIQEAEEKNVAVPAFTYVQSQTLQIKDRVLKGFVASIGQLQSFNDFLTETNEILIYLYGEDTIQDLISNTQKQKWSSTQFSDVRAYFFGINVGNYTKVSVCAAIPFFAL